MKNLGIKMLLAGIGVLALASFTVRADDDEDFRLRARLSPFQEVTPKAGSHGQGTFRASFDEDQQTITFVLTWENLTGPPLFAHIHVAQRGVNGAIVIFLCGPPTTQSQTSPGNINLPPCVQSTSGTATGTVSAADVLPAGNATLDQGVTTGDLADVIRAIRAGDGYANVHTPRFPGGEIRGQIKVRDEDERRERHDRD